MIKVNTRDIVKRAQQLADLENSDFISWNENVNLLNEAYSKLYQKLINHDDKAFLKSFETTSGKTELPDDFFQLYSVKTVSGDVLLRQGKTDSRSASRYEIRNGEIEIFGYNDKVIVEYWPEPQTLTLSAEDKELAVDSDIVCANGTKYVVDNFDETCIVVDVATDKTKSVSFSSPVQIGVKSMSDGDGNLYSFISNGAITFSGSFLSSNKCDGVVYVWTHNGNSFVCNTVGGENLQPVAYAGTSWESYRLIPTDKTVSTCYAIDPYGNVRLLDVVASTITEIIYNGLINVEKAEVRDGSLWYETNDGVKCNGRLVLSASDYLEYVSLMKVDGSTGYGAIVKNLDGDFVIRSVFDDTELDFPESFYFQFIAYLMAIAYKVKQNADVTGLSAMMSEAEEQFYDMLGSDSNEPVRIQNAYGRF